MDEKLKYISEHKQFEGATTLYEPIERVAKLLPKLTALRFLGHNISYGTLDKTVNKYARILKEAGLVYGEAVTAALPNIPESVYVTYAAAKAGMRISPLHPLIPPEGVKTAIERSGSRIVFMLGDSAEKVAKACPAAAVIAVSPANSLRIGKIVYGAKNPLPKTRNNIYTLKDFLAGKCKLPPVKSCPAKDNTAILLQSGGTTGTPKIIGLSAQSVNNLAKRGLGILGREHVTDCGMLSVLPVFHGFGLAMGMHAMLCHGGKNVLFPKFHRAQAVKEILRGNIQFMIGVPRLYEALLSHPKFAGKPLSKLVVAFVGGDFVPHTLLEKFDKRVAEGGGVCRLFEGYGLTETVTVCSVNTYAQNRATTVGKPLAEMEIAAFDFSDEPKKLAPGEKGELAVAGDTLMEEYLSDSAATEKVFFTYDGKRFVRTGDCGYTDEDGFVHFLSRIKRIVKIKGIPVYPLEIEQLVSAVDGVTGVCAAPVSDGESEERIVLFVESKRTDLTEFLPAYIGEKISDFAVPSEIHVLASLPLTNVSKIDAKKLLAEFVNR